jgi:hypothetical protein
MFVKVRSTRHTAIGTLRAGVIYSVEGLGRKGRAVIGQLLEAENSALQKMTAGQVAEENAAVVSLVPEGATLTGAAVAGAVGEIRAKAAARGQTSAENQRSAQAAVDKAAADKVAADKVAADKVAADKVAADKVAADKVAADKVAADKVAADKVAADKVAADKVAADKVAADKVAAEKAAADKAGKK